MHDGFAMELTNSYTLAQDPVTDTVQKRQHYLFIFICLHIPCTSQLSAENENTHIGRPFVAVKGQQSIVVWHGLYV